MPGKADEVEAKVLSAKVDGLIESIGHRFKCLDDSTTLARTEMNRRLGEMNELRDQLTAQANTFITRDAYDARHEDLQKQVNLLREFKATIDAKASQSQLYLTFILALLGFLTSIITGITFMLHR